ncbi:hypothetical protein PTKU46_78760 [Paraburkholderia terrae]|uniref:hypothetical protein n=1 Tax=Paraburkholderia terrae TaxID=311230 RepID=UPI0030DECB34
MLWKRPESSVIISFILEPTDGQPVVNRISVKRQEGDQHGITGRKLALDVSQAFRLTE